MKKIISYLLRFGLSIGVLVALFWFALRDPQFDENLQTIREHGLERWPLLLAGWAIVFGGILITIFRWFLLVRTLDLPFTFRNALRLGFLGYMLNFVSLGSVGGDLFKAIFIARENRGRRPEAVATVVVDRIIGLYGLFLVAALAIILTGQVGVTEPFELRIIVRATLISTAIGGLGIVMLLVPGFTSGAVSEMLGQIPRIGPVLERLIGAIRMYRRNIPVLLICLLMSMGVHSCATIGCYLIASALPGNMPTLQQQFLIVPLVMVAGAVPLMPAGLGAVEAAFEFLYLKLGVNVAAGQGLLVGVTYRVITILNAGVGAIIFLSSKKEMSALMHEVEEAAEEGPPPQHTIPVDGQDASEPTTTR